MLNSNECRASPYAHRMDKVVLSRAARTALGERLGQPIPNPESEAFDALLEELREMQPDLYTDLVGALEYKGEALPVEKEALRAQKRAHRQKLADHLKNRRTHDGKRVPDKRKSLLLGGALATVMMGWIGYTNISNGFTARAAATAEARRPHLVRRPRATPHLDRGGLSHRVAQLCRAAGFEHFDASFIGGSATVPPSAA